MPTLTLCSPRSPEGRQPTLSQTTVTCRGSFLLQLNGGEDADRRSTWRHLAVLLPQRRTTSTVDVGSDSSLSIGVRMVTLRKLRTSAAGLETPGTTDVYTTNSCSLSPVRTLVIRLPCSGSRAETCGIHRARPGQREIFGRTSVCLPKCCKKDS